METQNSTLNFTLSTTCTTRDEEPFISDNTLTFIIGFGILILFIILGILASAFLCFTLKKDPYLWDAEQERQLQEKDDLPATNCNEILTQESTQI